MGREVKIYIAEALGIILLIIGLRFLVKTGLDNNNERTYNHGVCTECGGHYEFINVATSRGVGRTNRYYYYKCDRCDKIIEISK